MAKVTLRSDLQSISGRVGNVLFKTYTKSDGTKETRAYSVPRKSNGSFGYERKTKVSPNEIAMRSRFSAVSMAINQLTDEQRDNYHRDWRKNKLMFNGKKYVSLRGYIMARMYAEMKERESSR